MNATRLAATSAVALAIASLVAAALLGLALLSPQRAAAAQATFTVNSIADGPDLAPGDGHCDSEAAVGGDQCTLRAAIQEANSTADMDTIDFAIPGRGAHTIAPATDLPTITQPVDVNGYSQRGASANTLTLSQGDNAKIKIQLTGRLISTAGDGLRLDPGAINSVVRGLAMSGFGTAVDMRAGASVQGDFIGTDPSGMHAVRNGEGVFVNTDPGFFVNIGGPGAPFRNVISGNHGEAVGANTRVLMMNNYVGVASDGRSPLGNRVGTDAGAVSLFGPSNVVGGGGEFANVIAFNDSSGIALENNVPPTVISENRIYANEGQAIDLQEDGRTPNDPGDGDTGPNGLQNFPVLRAAKTAHGHTRVKGKLDSTPNMDFTLEFFSSPRGTSGAKRFLGDKQISIGATGNLRFEDSLPKVTPGSRVTATARDLNGATSELSPGVRVKSRLSALQRGDEARVPGRRRGGSRRGGRRVRRASTESMRSAETGRPSLLRQRSARRPVRPIARTSEDGQRCAPRGVDDGRSVIDAGPVRVSTESGDGVADTGCPRASARTRGRPADLPKAARGRKRG